MLLKVYVLFITWTGLVIICFLQGIVTCIFGCCISKKTRIAWCSQIFNFIAYYSFTIFFQSFWKIKLKCGKIPPVLPRKLLIISDHTSIIDAWSISCLFYHHSHWFKYVAKGDLFKLPIFGWILQMGGDLSVNFTTEKQGWGV